MKQLLIPIPALFLASVLGAFSWSAGAAEKMVIALQSSDFELAETDISSLAVGESKTIETESGKIIDIIKTADGAEIYVDGEMIDMNHPQDGHTVEKHVEVICDDGENCDRDVIVIAGHATELSEWVVDGGDNVIIHKEIIHACDEGGETSNCADEALWIDGQGEVDVDEFHQMHEGEEGHKVIVIKKHLESED
jgi:hypothetical protein